MANGATIICPKCRTKVPAPPNNQKTSCPSCGTHLRATPKDGLLGTVVAGLRIDQRLGGGSMGTVYKAHDGSGAVKAIKILTPSVAKDEELLARFQREARLATSLRHRHLVASESAGEEHGRHYMVMELIEGKSLARILDASGAMGWKAATKIIFQMAECLAYLEQQGVVHRDIKPENILLDKSGNVLLADLGFAKRLSGDDDGKVATGRHTENGDGSKNDLTLAGTALGSPAYMAPEQVMDASQADHATDIYCLGATWYHLLTGRMPFDGPSAMAVMEKVLRERPMPIDELVPDLPVGVSTMVQWMMQKESARRPPTAAETLAQIRTLLSEPETPRGPAPKAGGVGLAATIILGLLVLGAAIGAYILWWR